ncbi:MAG: 1-acyl-sn-glycerol-3-phosphate acyltransferase [Hydrogenophaga sp.]|nr:1-acyl-sn-glycerol-3-phosphate acyltransferase [Hydrogenophaga sp.]
MSPVRPRTVAVWRMVRATAHVVRGIWIIRTRFDRQTPEQIEATVAQWSRDMLRIMGVQLEVRGQAPTAGPCLVVSNHISWLDILVINAAQPVRFVSKAAVLRWPLIGQLVAGAGTLFIERESRRGAVRMVQLMAERLQAGDRVAVFPEGTTGDGRGLLPFHPNLLQSAIAADAPIVPVALRYVKAHSQERHDAPVFVGTTTLVASIWTTLRARELTAVVHYTEAQTAAGRDRRAWAQDLHNALSRVV